MRTCIVYITILIALVSTLGKKDEACFLVAEKSGTGWQKSNWNGFIALYILHFDVKLQLVPMRQTSEQRSSIILVWVKI